MKVPTAADRVRQRLKEELRARCISQRVLADRLAHDTRTRWTQSKVGKVLNGGVELKVDDAEAIAKIAGIYLTECVRDRGLEFYAEMSPSELRVLERMRQRPHYLHAVMLMLDMVPAPVPTNLSPPVKRGRPLTHDPKKNHA